MNRDPYFSWSLKVPRLARIREHVTHHIRFYTSILIGVIVWAATGMLVQPVRLMVAGDSFFGVYLVQMAILATRARPEDMRRRARFEDEGIILIVLIALTAISLSIGWIFALLNEAERPDTFRLALAIASVPLGWLTLHTIAAFHYAHLYYGEAMSSRGDRQDAGGLEFPETSEPTGWDFLYYSFVIGMTAQVSDDAPVDIGPWRRIVLLQYGHPGAGREPGCRAGALIALACAAERQSWV